MKKIIIGAAALGLVFGSVSAYAQNMQGPAAPNFGATGTPQNGGLPNTPSASQSGHGVYNYGGRGRAQVGAGGAPGENGYTYEGGGPNQDGYHDR